MKRKVLLVSVLVLLMLFAAAPLMSLPANAEESAEKPKVGTADAQPTVPIPTIIFQDDFESGWNWYAYDANNLNGADYWGIVYDSGYNIHRGTHSAWCAAVSDHPYGTYYYDNNMKAYMYRAVPSNYTNFTFQFSYDYWIQNEPNWNDFLQVVYLDASGWHPVFTHYGSTNNNWVQNYVHIIPSYAQYVGFYFYSDNINANYFGSYIDDVSLIGIPKPDSVLTLSLTPNPASPGQTVTLQGKLYSGFDGSPLYPAQVVVDYSTDGGATWHSAWTLSTNTAGQFSKSFTAPGAGTYKVRASYAGSVYGWKPSSHTETLTVTGGAPPTVEIWTDKTTYARGQTLTAKIQAFNPGPAVAVKVNCWFGLPGGGTYMYETYYTGTIPASYTSPVYTWKSVTIPTSAATGTYSVNAEMRNPATNALIDSDTYYFTIS